MEYFQEGDLLEFFTVDMKALRNTSSYITNWSLRRGDTYFCALSLKILVQWSGGFERYD